MSKTLILSSNIPNSGGVGDIYINNIISNFDKSLFVRASIVKQQNLDFYNASNEIDSMVISIKKSNLPVISTYYFIKFMRSDLLKITDKIILFLKKENIENIWVTLSSPEIIILVGEISKKLNIKIYSTIWDVPEYLLQNNHLDPITCKFIKSRFTDILDFSERISVIDEGMKSYLPSKYKSKSVIIRNGVTFPSFNIFQKKAREDNAIKIAFAGSIYAKKEWNAFVQSLISCNFKINGKQVELICIGRLPKFGIIKDKRIDFRPHMANDNLLRILSSCDIGYVPYWFSKRKQLIVKTSFPGKIASYLSISLKIMFHGPSSSSVSHFLDEYEVGKCCHSLNFQKIQRTIEEIDNLNITEEQIAMAKKIFSQEAMLASFSSFFMKPKKFKDFKKS